MLQGVLVLQERARCYRVFFIYCARVGHLHELREAHFMLRLRQEPFSDKILVLLIYWLLMSVDPAAVTRNI
jgi:hypothetical protein